MNAMYFYNRLLGYEEERRKTRKYYYGYSNGMVFIHLKNDENTWFVVYRDGTVLRHTKDGCIYDSMNIKDLDGNDFELFNDVQIIKSGYIVLGTKTEYEVKKVISDLHDVIDSYYDGVFSNSTKQNIPYLCGGSCWKGGVTDGFQYYDINGIELELKTVRKLCEENVHRKHYNAKCIPFNKYMDNTGAIHVRFVASIDSSNYDEICKECDEALKNLFSYISTIDMNCRWIETKLRKPIYC